MPGKRLNSQARGLVANLLKYFAAERENMCPLVSVNGVQELANNKEWGFHNARVNSVAWSPDSQLVASGSLDTSIIIWHVEKPAKHIIIKNAHAQSQVTRLSWVDNQTLVSVGQDCNTKLWTITPF